MEELKPLNDLLAADERWKYFVFVNRETNEITPASLEHRYRTVEDISLSGAVPEDVRSQFNVARMLCVYAWLYYPFHQTAELKAFSTVEMALKMRFPKAGRGLHRLLGHAVSEGVISDFGFSHVTTDPSDPTRYSRTLADVLPKLRNEVAHGTVMLHPNSTFTVRNCAEIINQLFPPSMASESPEV